MIRPISLGAADAGGTRRVGIPVGDRDGLGLVVRQQLVVAAEVRRPEGPRHECLRGPDRGLQSRAGVLLVDRLAVAPRGLLERTRLFAGTQRVQQGHAVRRAASGRARLRPVPTRCRSAPRRARGARGPRPRRSARRRRRGDSASTARRRVRAERPPPGWARDSGPSCSAISLRSNRSPERSLPVRTRFTTWETTRSFSLTPYFLGMARSVSHAAALTGRLRPASVRRARRANGTAPRRRSGRSRGR